MTTEKDREPLLNPEVTQVGQVTSRLPAVVRFLTGRQMGGESLPDDIHNRQQVRRYLATLCRQAADLLESQP